MEATLRNWREQDVWWNRAVQLGDKYTVYSSCYLGLGQIIQLIPIASIRRGGRMRQTMIGRLESILSNPLRRRR